MAMNEIQLYRKDLHQTTCITGRSLALLPPGESKKKCYRVVVGADTGIITCFRIKKGEAEVEFTTNNLDYPVARLMIGGPADKKDRIFFSSAQTIRGVTRKGKEFFRFATDGAEVLRGLHVDDTKIWTSGEYMFNYYIDTKDAGYYMSRDRINDLLIQPVINKVDHNAILACQDRFVRVLDVNKLHYESFVQGAVMSLSALKDASYNDVLRQKKDCGVLFGTDNGLLGEMRMDPDSIKPGWLQQNVRGLGAVTSLVNHDLTKNGIDDVVIGRDDGEIQVFEIEDGGASGKQVTELLSKSINECVQDIKVGTVSTTTFDEVIVASYSGRVSSFTTESPSDSSAQAFSAAPSRVVEKTLEEAPADSTASASASEGAGAEGAGAETEEKKKKKSSIKSFFGFKKKDKAEKEEKDKFVGGIVLDRPVPVEKPEGDEVTRSDPKEGEAKVAALRAEIEKLRAKVKTEKANFERMSKESVPVSTRSKIKSALTLDSETGTHKLTLEGEMPMDLVAIEGSPGVDLILLDSGNSVPSISAPPKGAGELSKGADKAGFLATLRIQGTNSRLQVQLMISEGTYGTLNAFVVTRVAPKVVHLVEHEIPPLSLHRTVPLDGMGAPNPAPFCEIKMLGSFTLSMMHAWVRTCFRDMPSKVPEEDGSGQVRYKFESTFCGSTVSCSYCKGEAVFRSNNVSVLATVKDVISREATQTKIKLDIKTPAIDEKAVVEVLRLMHPKLTKLLKLKEDIKYIDAVNELAATPEDKALLSPHLLQVLEKGDELKHAHANNCKQITFIEKVLEQLFVDRFKFKGINVKHRIAEVRQLVDNYSWESLVALFAAA
eukprot:Tamp_05225.p1 GENE.Tamp_05225~~Tamp_05225.p1  ORF type:complete len:853 (-),score=257.60 Tamp_05225:475-2967(-)